MSSTRNLPFATEETYHAWSRHGRVADWQREVLAFRLGHEEYALDILRVREILRLRPITEVPRSPRFVPGIISVRGTVIPVVDLRLRLRVIPSPLGKDARILIVTRGTEETQMEPFGVIVDAVRQVVRMRDEEVEPPPAMLAAGDAQFVAGIGRPRSGAGMLILLNLDEVLAFQTGRKQGGQS